jgi:hypothetical protein
MTEGRVRFHRAWEEVWWLLEEASATEERAEKEGRDHHLADAGLLYGLLLSLWLLRQLGSGWDRHGIVLEKVRG